LESLAVALLDFVVDFLAMDGDVGRRFDADFYNVAVATNDFDFDASIDDDAFTNFSGEYEHGSVLGVSG